MILASLGVILSMVVIARACDGFEVASNWLGRNLSDGVKGATINAIGSSMPELLATLIALVAFADKDGFSFGVGTTAGSAIFNSAIIPSLVIFTVIFAKIATSINISRKVILRDGVFLIAAELILIVILADGAMGVADALILLGTYILYMIVMTFSMSREGESGEDEEEFEQPECNGIWQNLLTLDLSAMVLSNRRYTAPNCWLLLSLSVGVITAACYLLVHSCYEIGEYLGVPVFFVSVIGAAAATSVPDTIISIKDAMKGNYNDSVANALGSNIFDICVCLGLPLLIFCLTQEPSVTINNEVGGSVSELRVLLLLFTVFIFGLLLIPDEIKIVQASLMLLTYILFVAYIIARAYGNSFAESVGMQLQGILYYLKM